MTLPNLGPGRVLAALEVAPSFWDWTPTWTRLDDLDGVSVASYSIDRGRQVELDRTDVGRAQVELYDLTGILDPAEAGSPFHGQIEPLRQVALQRQNPMTGVWHTRYRGFVESWEFATDPSQKLNRVTITLVDIFEALNAIEMTREVFSDPPVETSQEGDVYLEADLMGDRVKKLLERADVPVEWYVVLSGNVGLFPTTYSEASESVMTAIQEAVDAELPGVGNAYTDRLGRLAVHGRLAKKDPSVVLPTLDDPDDWDWSAWKAGDGAAVEAVPGTVAQIREFGFNRGVSTVINRAVCLPKILDLTPAEIAGQLVEDTASIGRYGVRSWSAENLQTGRGIYTPDPDTTALEETRRFAEWRVGNYASPQNRTTAVSFRSIQPGRVGAGYTWELLSEIDVSDQITLTVAGPSGAGGVDEAFYVEGVHEQVRPANPDFDDVTLSVDVSPKALFDFWPFE